MRLIKLLSFLFLLLCFFSNGKAQSTKVNNDADETFKLAKEYWQKEMFSLAYPIFKELAVKGANANSSIPAHIVAESKYYSIVCALSLQEPMAEKMAVDYIELEYNGPRAGMMSYYLAEYYFKQKNFTAANKYYDKATLENLTNAQIADMKFHQAYGYFTLQDFVKAKPLFNAIRQLKDNPNYIDANYYYGFIQFYDKKYKEALESFKLVETSPAYKNIVPFYIAEIYYFGGERDKAITYAKNALAGGNQFYDLQLRQLVGHALFEKRNYAEALPYLETYVNNTEKVRREDLYELSFCYYEAGKWNNAIKGFKQLGGKEDSLAQNSMYLLADAYLKINEKQGARNAFLFCATNSSNATQKEVSLFNYAKLSYELGFMDVAQREIKTFLNQYPKSKYYAEALGLQVAILANTSNYKEALALYNNLPQQTENAKRVYPKILFGRAVELINDQQLQAADDLLTTLLQVPYNNQYVAFTNFWKGEIAYRNGNVNEAMSFMNAYMKDPKANGEVNIENAKYTLAYCNLKKENYKTALDLYQTVSGKAVSSTSSQMYQDAFIRSADCYFMLKDFKQALAMYDAVLNENLLQADYALYQKAIINGANGKTNDKISLLQQLPSRFPNSPLIPESYLEIANTYLASEQWKDAIPYLVKIINDKKAANLHPQAYLKTGIAYFNTNDNKESLSYFKTLVVKYPNSTESDEAVEYIRKIFVEDQKPGEFVTFMRDNGKTVTYSEEDSLTYKAAYLRYEARDFEAAAKGFGNYISMFPNGKYALEANYFSAEINVSSKNYAAALPYYKEVAKRAPNRYAERSALQAARIYYFDYKDYANAEIYFLQVKAIATQQESRLEAMRGLLRCQYKLQKWTDALPNAQELLKEKGTATEDRLMANMVIAKNHQLNNKTDDAIAAYKTVVSIGKSELSAEAQYRIGELYLQKGRFADAEKAGLEVIKKYGSYEYWVTKSYILLGDVYFAQKDYFNAEATYKSVVENASIEELKTEAAQKLAKVIEEKNKANKVEVTNN